MSDESEKKLLSYEECREKAAEDYKEINRPGSAVRNMLGYHTGGPLVFVDDNYDAKEVARTFKKGLEHTMERFGEMVDMFSSGNADATK